MTTTPEKNSEMPKAQPSYTQDDVYETHDKMVKETYQNTGTKFNMKAASDILTDMSRWSKTSSEAMQALIALGGEAVVSTRSIEKWAATSTEIRNAADIKQANSMYEEIVDYKTNFYSQEQKIQADKILSDMRSGKITADQAITSFSKL